MILVINDNTVIGTNVFVLCTFVGVLYNLRMNYNIIKMRRKRNTYKNFITSK
jgi:hypothetical protein